jgi:hypothetical protein
MLQTCLHYRHSVSSKKYAEEQAEQAETNFLHMNRGEDGQPRAPD